MPAEITSEDNGSGLELERKPGPPSRPYDRRRNGLTARRRRGDAHRIIASVLAVLALVGCVTAILLLAVAPTAARLEGDIDSLRTRLASTQSELAGLRAATVRMASRGSRLTLDLHRVRRHVAGLSRTMHGLQGSSTLAGEQTDGLRSCFAQLHQELAGLVLESHSVHGRITGVGLSDSAASSPACGTALGAG
ncbi:MAG: hypothetical protein ACJ780_21920 [Solirubrobacteraceae bacterium]